MLRHLAIGFDANRERLSCENVENTLKLGDTQDCKSDILSTAQWGVVVGTLNITY
jgi:hypothetical protein